MTGSDPGWPPGDCRTCGRCCFSTSLHHVRVFGVDWDRMDERAQSFTVWQESRCFMRMDGEGGRCAALDVDARTGRFSCGVYEMRPDVCRSLERGSGGCRGELEAKAGRPEALVALLRRRRHVEGV